MSYKHRRHIVAAILIVALSITTLVLSATAGCNQNLVWILPGVCFLLMIWGRTGVGSQKSRGRSYHRHYTQR